jgi:radical SAM superfamily enzyme YgiQ (UPF0313 family)
MKRLSSGRLGKDICLIRPPAVESFRFSTGSITPPLGLAYIIAALEKAGREVKLIDAVASAPKNFTSYLEGYLVGLSLEEIVAKIHKDTKVVGISATFTHEWPAIARLIQLIKESKPEVTVVLGGEHITALPEFSLLVSGADVAVLGEGEETVVELFDVLENKGPLRDVNGIAYREKDRININPRRQRATKLDCIAKPAWDRIDLAVYHENKFVGGMDMAEITVPILATRGCPYQCTFCASPNMWTTKWVPRDPKLVVDELEHYVKTYGAKNFPFQDLTAIIEKDWIVRFCNEILSRNLQIFWQFPSGTRSEAIDDEVAGLMKKSGMINMGYAPESGSETTRKFIKKKVKTENLIKSIKSSVKAGLNVSLFFIVGFPHDTKDLLKENLDFMKTISELGISDVAVGVYLALPGTELFDSLYDSGKLTLDRNYFSHILQGSAIIPQVSHNDHLNRFSLAIWRIRINLKFYREKRKMAHKKGGAFALLFSGLGGLFQRKHATRLETALRNGVLSGLISFRCKFKTRWMPLEKEVEMMAGWDAVYRKVRESKMEAGCIAFTEKDSSQLYKHNVIKRIRTNHEAKWSAAIDEA